MLLCYRALTLLLLISLVAIILFLTLGNIPTVIVFGSLAVIILIFQMIIVKCPHCGTRPGIWVLAVWTLFLDLELYVADTLLLKKCPKCDKNLA